MRVEEDEKDREEQKEGGGKEERWQFKKRRPSLIAHTDLSDVPEFQVCPPQTLRRLLTVKLLSVCLMTVQ